MKTKIILISIVCIFLLANSISVYSFEINNASIVCTTDAEKPSWSTDDYWKYDMGFKFITRNDKGKVQLDIDADISNMVATVTGTTNMGGEQVYVLDLSGSITGDVSLFGAFDIAKLKGFFGGNAYINVGTLGIKEFRFVVDGQVKLLRWRDLDFVLSLDFDPHFDFFDFPIQNGEAPWAVNINKATLDAAVDVLGLHKEYSDSTSFMDNITLDRTETIDIGDFDDLFTYVLKGDWGKFSNLWYAPSAGYLVKVDESLLWKDGEIEAEFDLVLLDTNYGTQENQPPNQPSNPSPANHATDVNTNTMLRWVGGDPDPDDTVTYNVYLGTDSNLDSSDLVSEGQTSVQYLPAQLEKETTYYWKITAEDNNGERTDGDVWEFTTGSQTNNTPPSTPQISGPDRVEIPDICIFEAVSTDPDGDVVFYQIQLSWISGFLFAANHSGLPAKFAVPCLVEGDFTIRVRATDNISGWSDWSTHSLKCPKEKPIFRLFSMFLNRYFNTRLIDSRLR